MTDKKPTKKVTPKVTILPDYKAVYDKDKKEVVTIDANKEQDWQKKYYHRNTKTPFVV